MIRTDCRGSCKSNYHDCPLFPVMQVILVVVEIILIHYVIKFVSDLRVVISGQSGFLHQQDITEILLKVALNTIKQTFPFGGGVHLLANPLSCLDGAVSFKNEKTVRGWVRCRIWWGWPVCVFLKKWNQTQRKQNHKQKKHTYCSHKSYSSLLSLFL